METPYSPQIFLTAQPKSGDSRNFLRADYDLTVLPLCCWPVKALGSLTVCGTARTFPSAGWRCRRCCEELGWPGLPPGPLAAAGKHWARGSDWVNEEWGWWWASPSDTLRCLTHRPTVTLCHPSPPVYRTHHLTFPPLLCYWLPFILYVFLCLILSFFLSFFLSFLHRHNSTSQGGSFCN